MILHGGGFNLLPANALGISAIDNDNPLHYLNTNANTRLFSLSVGDDTTAVAIPNNAAVHEDPSYLGAIVSNDRHTIYWVNKTRPLPTV